MRKLRSFKNTFIQFGILNKNNQFVLSDKGNIVDIGNGFQKKTQKTPKGEIEKALRIKKEYEDENK